MGIRARLYFVRNVWRKAVDYIRYDLKEIVLPSSLPDPPGSQLAQKKIPLNTHLKVWRRALYIYSRTWKWSAGLIPEDEVDGPRPKGEKAASMKKEEPQEPTIAQELAAAAKAGGEGLRPVLQKLYMSRARGYRDALQSFVGGYQEGLKEAMEKAAKEDAVWKNEGEGVRDEVGKDGSGGDKRLGVDELSGVVQKDGGKGTEAARGGMNV